MVTLPIKCAAHGASCTVKVAVMTTVTVMKHGKKVHKTIVLGTRRATVGAGRSHTIKVTLSRAGRRLLATHRHLATEDPSPHAGGTGTTRTWVQKLTLRAAAHTRSRQHRPQK